MLTLKNEHEMTHSCCTGSAHKLLMDVMQRGRMLWIWVQHYNKMVMIADVPSAALIKSVSRVFQNVSTLYHFNTVLYSNTLQVTQTATALSLAVGRLSTNGNNYILQSIWSGPAEPHRSLALTCVPSALANFMPPPSSADNLCTLTSASLYSTQ
jgi:hypothetical protein